MRIRGDQTSIRGPRVHLPAAKPPRSKHIVSVAASRGSTKLAQLRSPEASSRGVAGTYGYLSGGVGVAVATGLGAARAGLFTFAAAHPLAFFVTSFATSQTALAATQALDPSHSALRHSAFVILGTVLGLGSAAIGPVGLGTAVGAAVLCASTFAAVSAASYFVPPGALKATDRTVAHGSKAWFALSLASLAVPPLGALRSVQVLLAVGGAGLFATQLMRNTQQMRSDAARHTRYDAMQAAIGLGFPTFCLFTFSPSFISAAAAAA